MSLISSPKKVRVDEFSFLLWFWVHSSAHVQILMFCLAVKIAFSNTLKLPGWCCEAQGKKLIKQLLISSRHTLPVSPLLLSYIPL